MISHDVQRLYEWTQNVEMLYKHPVSRDNNGNNSKMVIDRWFHFNLSSIITPKNFMDVT